MNAQVIDIGRVQYPASDLHMHANKDAVTAAIHRRSGESLATIGDLAGREATPSQLAFRYGVSVWAIYKRRRRFEKSINRNLERYEKRGCKPTAIPIPA